LLARPAAKPITTAALHAQIYAKTMDAAMLIPHMLEAFMAGDRDSEKNGRSNSDTQNPPALAGFVQLWVAAQALGASIITG